MSYRCVEIISNSCVKWVEYQDFLNLQKGEGLEIGGQLFVLTIGAWGIRTIARLILNKK